MTITTNLILVQNNKRSPTIQLSQRTHGETNQRKVKETHEIHESTSSIGLEK